LREDALVVVKKKVWLFLKEKQMLPQPNPSRLSNQQTPLVTVRTTIIAFVYISPTTTGVYCRHLKVRHFNAS
jgi:hypothetical protein